MTMDTVGLLRLVIISAMAKPASTSPPAVFNTMSIPFTLLSLSIAINCGIINSYLVDLV